MKTATKIKQMEIFIGDAILYKLSEETRYTHPVDGPRATLYVVVSSVTTRGTGIPETYMFPTNSEGDVITFLEMAGSEKNTLSHEKVLTENQGWTILEGDYKEVVTEDTSTVIDSEESPLVSLLLSSKILRKKP